MNKPLKTRILYLIIFAILIIVLVIYRNQQVEQLKQFKIELNPEEIEWKQYNKIIAYHPLKNYNSTLFNLTLNYTLNPPKCDNSTTIIIIVTSYFGNIETRSAMRRAFSATDLKSQSIRRVFLLGRAPKDVYTKPAAIVAEHQRFNDLVQGNFVEAYRNLTYKHLMGLKWAGERCPAAKYVIKMDDDIVVDLRKMINHLKWSNLPKNLLAGYIFRGLRPKRDPANKWYVTEEEYEHPLYPTFVSGWFYVTTPRVAAKLVLLSHYYKYFWIDDVYVTGMLAGSLRIRHHELGGFFTTFPEFLRCCMDGFRRRVECSVAVGPNGGDNNLFFEFNQVAKSCDGGQCGKRSKSLNETCVAERKISLNRGSAFVRNYKLH